MSRLLLLVAVISTVVQSANPVSAQVVYSTGFENPPFDKHSQLVGQDGWVGFSVPDLFNLSPNAAEVTTGIHADGHQAVRVRGKDLEQQEFLSQITGGYYDAIGSYRRAVNYETNGTQTVRVSSDVYVQGGGQTPDGDNFFSASVATRTALTDGGTAGTGELAISSDGHVYGYSGNENAPTFLTSAPVTLNEWHNLAVDVNPGARNFTFLLDGTSLGTFDFPVPDTEDPSIDYTTVLTRGSILAYGAPDRASLKKQNFSAHFDNFSITASPAAAAVSVPEPAGVVLASCGILALFACRGARRSR